MIKHDYKKFDKIHSFNYKNDRLKQANKLGYTYISECIVELYRKYQSSAEVAKYLKITPNNVLAIMKKIGEPRCNRGGYRDRRKHKPQIIRKLLGNKTSTGETRSDYESFSEYQ
jgi:hypothetical protein